MSLSVEAAGYLRHIIEVMNSGHRLPYNRFHWTELQWNEYAGLQELEKDGWVI